MKSFVRGVAAAALAAFVYMSAPDALAQPRSRDARDRNTAIVKVIKQLKLLFGIGSQSDAPIPPRPSPPPPPDDDPTTP